MSDQFELKFYNENGRFGTLTSFQDTFTCRGISVVNRDRKIMKLTPKIKYIMCVIDILVTSRCEFSPNHEDIGKFKVIKSSYSLYYGGKGILWTELSKAIVPSYDGNLLLQMAGINVQVREDQTIVFKLLGDTNIGIKYDWHITFR